MTPPIGSRDQQLSEDMVNQLSGKAPNWLDKNSSSSDSELSICSDEDIEPRNPSEIQTNLKVNVKRKLICEEMDQMPRQAKRRVLIHSEELLANEE